MRHVTLFFEPLDVLVFRDHRPFMAGQHFLARGVYPLPSVFFGAVRAALFERVGVRFIGARSDPFTQLTAQERKVLGDADAPGCLELAGPLLARRNGPAGRLEVYLPWPRDLDTGTSSLATHRSGPLVLDAFPVSPSPRRTALRWRPVEEGRSSMSTLDHPLPASDRPAGKPTKTRYLLTASGAEKYARASAEGLSSFTLTTASADICDERDLLIKERRTGIARSRADDGIDPLTVDESMLFTVETWRLAERVGFAVDISLSATAQEHAQWLHEQIAGLQHATVRLGGKGHLARIHVIDRPLLADLDARLPPARTPGTYKAWNLTPSLLDPAIAAPRPAMVLGDTIRLGGVNLRATRDRPRGPRPLIGALGPGSVVLYADERKPDDLSRQIDEANRRGEPHGHYRRAGYGIHRILPYRPRNTGSSQ